MALGVHEPVACCQLLQRLTIAGLQCVLVQVPVVDATVLPALNFLVVLTMLEVVWLVDQLHAVPHYKVKDNGKRASIKSNKLMGRNSAGIAASKDFLLMLQEQSEL